MTEHPLLGLAQILAACAFGLGLLAIQRSMERSHLKAAFQGIVFFCMIWHLELGIVAIFEITVPWWWINVKRWLWAITGIFFGLACWGVFKSGKL